MKYKALFLDVDGTIVIHGFHNVPSTKVTEAINKCKQINLAVCLATSRPLYAVRAIIEHLDLSGYCTISSGTQIYDLQKKKIVIEKLLPKVAMYTVMSVAKKYHAELRIFDGVGEVTYDGTNLPKKVVGVYFPELMLKIFQKINKELERVSDISLHRMPAWDKRFECLDITHKDASKLHAITEVAGLLGIQTHEMIGVGDGYNDFPLLMACGLKIAMGNAVPELKAIADFIAPSVEKDGVATVIEKFIL
jgi:HAD superfamily hydrolase (TIGR01484 family)